MDKCFLLTVVSLQLDILKSNLLAQVEFMQLQKDPIGKIFKLFLNCGSLYILGQPCYPVPCYGWSYEKFKMSHAIRQSLNFVVSW